MQLGDGHGWAIGGHGDQGGSGDQRGAGQEESTGSRGPAAIEKY